MGRWTTRAFWADAIERGLRAAAASALGLIGAGQAGLLAVPWQTVGSVAGLAAVVSLLTSLAAGWTGDPGTAGFATARQYSGPRPM